MRAFLVCVNTSDGGSTKWRQFCPCMFYTLGSIITNRFTLIVILYSLNAMMIFHHLKETILFNF